MHGWAGHMARKKEMHPGAAAIEHKNVELWEIIEERWNRCLRSVLEAP